MSQEQLYPTIPFENVSEKYNRNLSDARIKEIQGKRSEMEKSLRHYKKILKKWKNIGSVLKIGSIIIVGGVGVTSIVLGFGAFALPLTLGILATIGATEGIISEAVILGVVKKKIIKLKKKIEHIQEYISKSWFLFEKIREDSIITLVEMDEFRKLIDQYEKGLNIDSDSENSEYLKLRESLKKTAEKEVKKEVKDDIKRS